MFPRTAIPFTKDRRRLYLYPPNETIMDMLHVPPPDCPPRQAAIIDACMGIVRLENNYVGLVVPVSYTAPAYDHLDEQEVIMLTYIKNFLQLNTGADISSISVTDVLKRIHHLNDYTNLSAIDISIDDATGSWYCRQNAITQFSSHRIILHTHWISNNNLHRPVEPARISTLPTGVNLVEAHYNTGILHNTNGPAITTRYTTGEMRRQEWFIEGRPARTTRGISDDRPIDHPPSWTVQLFDHAGRTVAYAWMIQMDEMDGPMRTTPLYVASRSHDLPSYVGIFPGSDDVISRLEWRVRGRYARANPMQETVQTFYRSGRQRTAQWITGSITPITDIEEHAKDDIDNKLTRHRADDAPAYVEWHETGDVHVIGYYVNGVLHRINNAALYVYGIDGTSTEYYYENGLLHRIGGPAVVAYDHNRTVMSESFYAYGLQQLVFSDSELAVDGGPPAWVADPDRGSSTDLDLLPDLNTDHIQQPGDDDLIPGDDYSWFNF